MPSFSPRSSTQTDTMASKVEMTYAQALAAFNTVMAADPRIQALGKRAWGDVVYAEEQEAARPPVCPWAPKKADAPARPLVVEAPMAKDALNAS